MMNKVCGRKVKVSNAFVLQARTRLSRHLLSFAVGQAAGREAGDGLPQVCSQAEAEVPHAGKMEAIDFLHFIFVKI